ncbi:MAG: hypothetical protein M1836_004663 [Candelina mexicana]|nr:MAG: hypothetical protein M1836_004663 [Candelina mexicana]
MVAFTTQQLAATCTSYGLFDPGGITPQDSLLPLLAMMRQLHLPCLFDWHSLRKPASRQRPLQLLGSEDINGHWGEEGVGQTAIAGGGEMAKELGIPAIAVPHSVAMAMAGRFSYGYSTLEQCTPYGDATPRKPSLSGGIMITSFDLGGVQYVTPLLSASRNSSTTTPSLSALRNSSTTSLALYESTQHCTLYKGAIQQKTSTGGNRKPTTHVANQQLAAKRTSNHPFDPGGLSSLQSWLINLPCCLLLAAAISTPHLPPFVAVSIQVVYGQGISIGTCLGDYVGV